jgi:hypothetical protein
MKRKYLVAVALLAVLAVAFGVIGTVAPPLGEESTQVQPQQESSPESVGHFQNPPSYDSGWVDITANAGQYVTLKHDLNTSEVVVDITGKQSLDPKGGALAWSRTYGRSSYDDAASVIQTDDGGYALAGSASSFGAGGYDFWLVKTDSAGSALWNRTYGGTNNEYAQCVVQTSDGGYALAGYTRSYGAGIDDFWLVKTDSVGIMQWSQTYGGTGYDRAYSLVQTGDGGYALAGSTDSFGAGDHDFWFVKTDSDGNHLWNQTYGGTGVDIANSMVELGDGGYALAGYTYSYGAGYSDFWLVKTDSSGDHLWNQTYGGTSDECAYSLVQTSDGGYVLAGFLPSSGADWADFWLVKTDSDGNHLWNQTYGGTGVDIANSMVELGDGGYALAGYTTSFGAGGSDFWLVKTDVAGNHLWNKTYGGVDSDRALSVVQTGDGGYALAGYTTSYGAGLWDSWLVKVKTEMNLEHQRNLGSTQNIQGWSRTYGGANGDGAHAVVQTGDGGYALAGYTDSYGAGQCDFWLVKTDSSGNVLWSRTYGGANGDGAHAVVQTGDGGYALAGLTYSFGAGGADFWLVKTDSAGTVLWNKTYGGANDDYSLSMVETGDGGYALAGYTDSYGAGGSDVWLVKTDGAGNVQWSRTYGGTHSDAAYSLVQTVDGGYALAGTTSSFGAGLEDFWLVKTDSSGIMQWSQTYGGTGYDRAYSLVQTGDGGYALAGWTGSFGAGLEDFWLVKTDSSGNVLWSRTYGGANEDIARAVVQTGDGGYALAGYTDSYGAGGYDFWLVKTDCAGVMEWSQTYGGASSDLAYSVVETGDGYALASATYSFGAGLEDFWLVKTDVELGLIRTGFTNNTITLYRGKTDPYWNYVRVRIWLIKEPSWIYGDINMDGTVDAKDLYILSRNYGKTFSLLSLSGIIAIAGIHKVKKRKQSKQPSYIS